MWRAVVLVALLLGAEAVPAGEALVLSDPPNATQEFSTLAKAATSVAKALARLGQAVARRDDVQRGVQGAVKRFPALASVMNMVSTGGTPSDAAEELDMALFVPVACLFGANVVLAILTAISSISNALANKNLKWNLHGTRPLDVLDHRVVALVLSTIAFAVALSTFVKHDQGAVETWASWDLKLPLFHLVGLFVTAVLVLVRFLLQTPDDLEKTDVGLGWLNRALGLEKPKPAEDRTTWMSNARTMALLKEKSAKRVLVNRDATLVDRVPVATSEGEMQPMGWGELFSLYFPAPKPDAPKSAASKPDKDTEPDK